MTFFEHFEPFIALGFRFFLGSSHTHFTCMHLVLEGLDLLLLLLDLDVLLLRCPLQGLYPFHMQFIVFVELVAALFEGIRSCI